MKNSTTKRYAAREKFENQILEPAQLIHCASIVGLENDSNYWFRVVARIHCIYNQFYTCKVDGQNVLVMCTDHPDFLKTLRTA